ncbi:MAG: caspase family protein, partial [Pirellulales bacterium]|nr:caspase family protein [Pirellulales bacterium]
RAGDEVVVKVYRKDSGQLVTELQVTRPEVTEGRISRVKADEGQFWLKVKGEEAKEMQVNVPRDLEIGFNAGTTIEGRPVSLADLRPDDRVVVHHLADDQGRRATELAILRVVTAEGVVRSMDKVKGTLTFAQGEGDKPLMITLPINAECEVTINDRRILNERQLKPADLRPGDQVKLAHDDRIVRVNAYRVLGQEGTIATLRVGDGQLDVTMKDDSGRKTFMVGPETTVSLGGETVELKELRVGDQVEIRHDSPDARTPRALTIAATRLPDPRRWAALVSVQDYEDMSVGRLDYPESDAKLLQSKLVERYRVAEDHVLALTDPSRVRFEQGLADFLGRVPSGANLVVYFAGHAFKADDGKIYLAPKNFELRRAAVSGVALQWLVDQMEQCPAKEKLLLLDGSYAGAADSTKEPSTAEMIDTLDALPGRPPFRTVTAVASCSEGQRALAWPEKEHGLFAYFLAEGFAGRADANRDTRLEPTELFTYLKDQMDAAAEGLGQPQSPRLFLPDASPPRLSENAKKAIRRLASFAGQSRVNKMAVGAAYDEAKSLANDEPEPDLLHGVLLVEASQWAEAAELWQTMKVERPDGLIPLEAIAWIDFIRPRSTYDSGVDDLVELVGKVPRPKKPGMTYPENQLALFEWVGQLREFASTAAKPHQRPTADRLGALDAAVASHGQAAAERYNEGRGKTRAMWDAFARKLDRATQTNNEAAMAKLRIECHRLVHYAAFRSDALVKEILAGLDR